MCTVTYIPTTTGYIICSNRDECKSRPSAHLHKNSIDKTDDIWYPIDGSAGGSWIALKQNSNAAILLNGAFEKHVSNPPYKISRGQIFLSIVKQNNLLEAFININLENIEPFTLIIKSNPELYECHWNGNQKYHTKIDNLKPHIWSSCTLYNKEVRIKRNDYFLNWVENKQSNLDKFMVLELHQSKPFEDKSENFLLEREDGISTVSITCLSIEANKGSIYYQDNKQETFQDIIWELDHINQQTIINV